MHHQTSRLRDNEGLGYNWVEVEKAAHSLCAMMPSSPLELAPLLRCISTRVVSKARVHAAGSILRDPGGRQQRPTVECGTDRGVSERCALWERRQWRLVGRQRQRHRAGTGRVTHLERAQKPVRRPAPQWRCSIASSIISSCTRQWVHLMCVQCWCAPAGNGLVSREVES